MTHGYISVTSWSQGMTTLVCNYKIRAGSRRQAIYLSTHGNSTARMASESPWESKVITIKVSACRYSSLFVPVGVIITYMYRQLANCIFSIYIDWAYISVYDGRNDPSPCVMSRTNTKMWPEWIPARPGWKNKTRVNSNTRITSQRRKYLNVSPSIYLSMECCDPKACMARSFWM